MKKTSRFAKYDLRDGFWLVPVAGESRQHLLLRHPATGRLMKCARLPFGYEDSPRQFAKVIEEIAAELRRRLAGRGVWVFVYVDDFLIVGDNEDTTVMAMLEFERLLDELGVQWAPHKQRGPCSAIEFLGLMLLNTPEYQGVSLSEKRLGQIMAMLNEWRGRHAVSRQATDGTVEADPREVAHLLGHLVFVAQCVSGGRAYMSGMLSQFRGLEVDWRRGQVRAKDGEWQRIVLTGVFWRDLEWWSRMLPTRHFVEASEVETWGGGQRTGVGSAPRRTADAVIAGTDASGWGTG